MLSVTSLRAGTTFEENGDIFVVMAYEHMKMGRGSANVKVKVRNLRSGSVTEKSYISHGQVNNILLEKKEFQYLYKDSDSAYFMDQITFEQISVPLKVLYGKEFLKEGEIAILQFYNDEPLDLILPPKVTLKVEETAPGVKGDSASNVYKDAILENGMRLKVPLFINDGDMIVVDTRDASYTKRA